MKTSLTCAEDRINGSYLHNSLWPTNFLRELLLLLSKHVLLTKFQQTCRRSYQPEHRRKSVAYLTTENRVRYVYVLGFISIHCIFTRYNEKLVYLSYRRYRYTMLEDRIYGYIGKISLTVSLIIAKGKNYSIEGAFHSILIKNNQYSSVNKCNRSFINYISRHRHIFSFLSKSIHPTTRHHNLGLYNLSLQIFIVNFTRRVGFIKATKKLLVNMDPTINHIQVN